MFLSRVTYQKQISVPPTESMMSLNPEKSTSTTWLIGIPKSCVMVAASTSVPSLYAELMRLSELRPAMFTHRSRGRLSSAAPLPSFSWRRIMIVSLRWPDTAFVSPIPP